MTILQALADRYDRLAGEGKAPVPGFAPAQLSFAIVLSPDGIVVAVDDLRTADKKRRPTPHEAPQAPRERRGEKIVPGSFWDPSDYSLGLVKIDPSETEARRAKLIRKASEKHAAFKQWHEKLLGSLSDSECMAMLLFLKRWNPLDVGGIVATKPDLAGANITFRLDGKLSFIFQSLAARVLCQERRRPCRALSEPASLEARCCQSRAFIRQ